jgi:hypothetical protein
MPTLNDILGMLTGQAQARPDLGEAQPLATYAGRIVRPGMSLQDVLSQFPQAEAEEAGRTALGLSGIGGAGAATRMIKGKTFKDASKFFPAPNDAVPLSSINQMRPAFINPRTGEVMVNQAHIGGGGHDTLQKLIDAMPEVQRKQWQRGFADELSGLGFTDRQLVPGSYR